MMVQTGREDGPGNVTRGGGWSCESTGRIYFLCVGRRRNTSVLEAEGRPDHLDTTSITNCCCEELHPHSSTPRRACRSSRGQEVERLGAEVGGSAVVGLRGSEMLSVSPSPSAALTSVVETPTRQSDD